MLGMAVPRKVGVRKSRGSQYVSCFVCLLDAVWCGDLLSKEGLLLGGESMNRGTSIYVGAPYYDSISPRSWTSQKRREAVFKSDGCLSSQESVYEQKWPELTIVRSCADGSAGAWWCAGALLP